MSLKFAATLLTGLVVAGSLAEAKTSWNLYGAVPVDGDRVLELAYSDALAHCRFESYHAVDQSRRFAVDYDEPEMVSCMSRKGFVHQGGKPHAYPFPKESHEVRVRGQ